MKLAVIGVGNRGTIYTNRAKALGHQIDWIVDINQEHLDAARERLGTPREHCFLSAEEFFKLGKVADAVIISTLDQCHHEHAMGALEVGYPLLLEKPISNSLSQCLDIRDKAAQKHLPVTVCHVLRYTPFFMKVKEILAGGALGKVVTIQHNENIGNFHFAHSFVRGNWRNADESAPLILAKSCHDLDMLCYLVGSAPKSVSSFGDLTYFKAENAPEGAAQRCMDCPVSDTCRYDARKCYLPVMGAWPANVLTQDQTEEGLLKAIKTGPYGRCVYHCDNNVCDHQVSIIRFENGVTATFNLSAMTNCNTRTLKIMCEKGELRANMELGVIELTEFASNYMDEYASQTICVKKTLSGHGGGDFGLMDDFLASLQDGKGSARTSIEESTASHILAFAAEEARHTNTVVDISAFEKEMKE